MGRENLTSGDIEIEKNDFYCNKTPFFLRNVCIEKLLISKKISFGEKNCKYFIGYLNNDNRVKPLHIMLPKTSAFVKRYESSNLAVISLNSTLKKDKNCYPQVAFKKCKYIEKKVMRHIINDLESSCDDSDDFDEE